MGVPKTLPTETLRTGGLPSLRVLTGAEALEARMLARMYETTTKTVPTSPIVTKALQPQPRFLCGKVVLGSAALITSLFVIYVAAPRVIPQVQSLYARIKKFLGY